MKAAPRLSGRRHHALGLAELAQSAHPALGLAGAPVSKHQPSGCGTNGVFSCNVPFNGRPEFPAAAACCSVESRVRVCLSKIIGSRGILPPLVGLTSPGTHAARSRRTRAGSRGGCRMIAGSPADDHGRRSALCQSVSSALAARPFDCRCIAAAATIVTRSIYCPPRYLMGPQPRYAAAARHSPAAAA